MGRAAEDGMLEGFMFCSAPGAGEFGFLVEPGGVGHKITFGRAHLMPLASHELA